MPRLGGFGRRRIEHEILRGSLIAQKRPAIAGGLERVGVNSDPLIFSRKITMLNRIVDAPPALRRFLEARARGLPHEDLKKLSDLALIEQAERAGKPPAAVIDLDQARLRRETLSLRD
ncbi:hypothetical protein HAP47_0020610 [Bradyrhizobium sp. 41S5]|uniref:hypothetical protein n=1 Tax=Bradyrhizobium sp. 41S5 TaxID=1404443 RepID=UPI00156B663D|nr:hypothetical protein [Bradyrhizobium sp. 41S5]UFX41716.1 hypothetical protein HAP47_0020610 [Bradyrhizobium sp. 41S5]